MSLDYDTLRQYYDNFTTLLRQKHITPYTHNLVYTLICREFHQNVVMCRNRHLSDLKTGVSGLENCAIEQVPNKRRTSIELATNLPPISPVPHQVRNRQRKVFRRSKRSPGAVQEVDLIGINPVDWLCA